MGPRKRVPPPLTPLVLALDQLGDISVWEEQLLAKLKLVKDVQVRIHGCFGALMASACRARAKRAPAPRAAAVLHLHKHAVRTGACCFPVCI